MLTRLFIVLFVEATNQLLKNGAHDVVIETRQSHASRRIQHGL